MSEKSTGRKIWEVLYPFLALLVLYFGVIYGGVLIVYSSSSVVDGSYDLAMQKNIALITCIALLIIFFVEGKFYKNDAPVNSYYLFKKPVSLFWIILLGLVASHGLNLLLTLLNTTGIFQSYETVQAEIFAPGVIFVIIRALILAPVVEELVFRGLIFRRMKAFTGFWPAALVSAALFGLYHMDLAQGIYAFLFGILLSWVYHKYNNLLASVALHFAANLLSVILTYTNLSYPSLAAFWISMIVMFAGTAALLLFVIRKVPDTSSD